MRTASTNPMPQGRPLGTPFTKLATESSRGRQDSPSRGLLWLNYRRGGLQKPPCFLCPITSQLSGTEPIMEAFHISIQKGSARADFKLRLSSAQFLTRGSDDGIPQDSSSRRSDTCWPPSPNHGRSQANDRRCWRTQPSYRDSWNGSLITAF